MEHKISKQSIRTGVSIYQSGEKLDKDKIISMSEKWSDKIIKISKKAKTLSDVRSGFLKEVNFLDVYEFALKNEMLK